MRGIWTALITPFNLRNELDLPSFKKMLRHQADAHVEGVVVCGSTGESITLSWEERKQLIQTAVQELKGSGIKVFAGTGTASTRESVEFSAWASNQGVDGVLIISPYYNRPSQAGLELHFKAIADAVKCEVTLYNHPGRTGVSLNADTIVQLAAHPRINSIKEASGSISFTNELKDLLQAKGRTLDVLAGDDSNYLPLMSVGALGVISVVSNLIPKAMVEIQRALEKNEHPKAIELNQKYYPLYRDLNVETNPVPIKYAMAYQGWCEAAVRQPLVPLLPGSAEKLVTTLKRCGITSERFP